MTDESDPAATLREFMLLLKYSRGGSFAFAVFDSSTIVDKILEPLQAQLAPIPFIEWTYTPQNPYPISYRDALSPEQLKSRAIVMIYEFEQANNFETKSLDFGREQYSSVPHNLVFWVGRDGLRKIANQASHFWSQRAGVFDFAQPVIVIHDGVNISSVRATNSRIARPDRTTLRDMLITNFNREELELLCYELGIDGENIGGTSKQMFAQNLVTFTERRGSYDQLVKKVREARPGLI